MQGVTPAVAFAAPLAMARPQAEVSAQMASAEAVQAATVKYAEPSEEQTVQGEHGDVPPKVGGATGSDGAASADGGDLFGERTHVKAT